MPRLDTNLLIERCPHCNVDKPNLISNGRFETNNFNSSDKRYWRNYVCQRCGGVTTAYTRNSSNLIIDKMYPSTQNIDDSIPDRAREYLNQAIDSKHAPAGSIMLSASSIDAMLKDKGYLTGKLYTRINQAVKDYLITKEMADWAHEVRLDANDQRHADQNAELPNEQDAQKTIDFAIALAQFLFVMPSKIKRGIKAAKNDEENSNEVEK